MEENKDKVIGELISENYFLKKEHKPLYAATVISTLIALGVIGGSLIYTSKVKENSIKTIDKVIESRDELTEDLAKKDIDFYEAQIALENKNEEYKNSLKNNSNLHSIINSKERAYQEMFSKIDSLINYASNLEDSLNVLNMDKSTLELLLTQEGKEIDEFSQKTDRLESELSLSNYDIELYKDSLNVMQDYLNGFLVTCKKPKESYLPDSVRYLPETKEERKEIRKLNKELKKSQ
jgi:chromosome segregation ATPase